MNQKEFEEKAKQFQDIFAELTDEKGAVFCFKWRMKNASVEPTEYLLPTNEWNISIEVNKIL